MSKKIIYTDESIEFGERMMDFLPHPSQLVKKEDTVKITSEFTRSSIDYLKREAKKAKVPYQRMLRSLIDLYVEQQENHKEL